MSRPRRNKTIEKELMEAIDRLLAAGDDVNHSSVAREAKRARGILSNEGSGYSAVRNRIAQIRAEASPPPATAPEYSRRSSCKEAQALRKANRELKREVTNVRSSLVALLAAQADSDRLEPQVADMQRRQAARADRLALESVVS
jgi:hypothetical protein